MLRIRVATLARVWESHGLATVATPKLRFDEALAQNPLFFTINCHLAFTDN